MLFFQNYIEILAAGEKNRIYCAECNFFFLIFTENSFYNRLKFEILFYNIIIIIYYIFFLE